jgi:hypothetical protein
MCARYFFFTNTACFCKLCLAAYIDSGKLWNYLLCIEKEAAGELCDTFDDPQASLCFPKNQDQPTGALYCTSGTQAHWKKALLENPITFFLHELERIAWVRRVPRLGPDYTCFANVLRSSASQIHIYLGVPIQWGRAAT